MSSNGSFVIKRRLSVIVFKRNTKWVNYMVLINLSLQLQALFLRRLPGLVGCESVRTIDAIKWLTPKDKGIKSNCTGGRRRKKGKLIASYLISFLPCTTAVPFLLLILVRSDLRHIFSCFPSNQTFYLNFQKNFLCVRSKQNT